MELVSSDLLKPVHGIGYSNSYLLRLEKEGKFPRRVRLSTHRYAYILAEIRAWNAARIAERHAKAA